MVKEIIRKVPPYPRENNGWTSLTKNTGDYRFSGVYLGSDMGATYLDSIRSCDHRVLNQCIEHNPEITPREGKMSLHYLLRTLNSNGQGKLLGELLTNSMTGEQIPSYGDISVQRVCYFQELLYGSDVFQIPWETFVKLERPFRIQREAVSVKLTVIR